MKKAYAFVIAIVDEHIDSVKSKINNAELLEREASLALKEAYVRKNDVRELIEKNRKESEEKIRRLYQENEQYLKTLRERFDASLQAQLEAELSRQKNLLMTKLSDQIIKKLMEQIDSADCSISTNFKKDDLRKLI
jgi:F0F1-type ATP synthase membrane subunit b/b'